MVTLSTPSTLARFADDELLRVPLLFDQTVDGALEHMSQGLREMSPTARAIAGDLMARLQQCRQTMGDYYLRSLKLQVAATLRGEPGGNAAAPASRGGAPMALSLVDEGEVAVDVEISHVIETIRSVAEYELRELQTFTAALVGDMDVARDHNPFRPETHARALWAAAQALPMSRGHQIAFMRHAALPLAQVLRKTFAAASSRLEASGIEPASHRTLILPSGSRRNRPTGPEGSFAPDLLSIRDAMPVKAPPASAAPQTLEAVLAKADTQLRDLPPETRPADFDALRAEMRRLLVESAPSAVDQQVVELVTRLFDGILADPALAPDIRLLLARLQAPALRVALRDPKALDKQAHPVWLFADQVAFYNDILPALGSGERERVLRTVQGLVEHVIAEEQQTAQLYHWALERLRHQERLRLEQRCQAEAAHIQALQALEQSVTASQAARTSLPGTIDVGQLDTVPAELIDHVPAGLGGSAQDWLSAQNAGAWLRLFLQGRWIHAQLLWLGPRGEIALLGDCDSAATWAVRRGALLRLHTEGLLSTLVARSLVRRAARRIMRQMVG